MSHGFGVGREGALPVLDLADVAAYIRRDLLREGLDIGMAGCLVAPGASFLTRNRRHFVRIEHLSLVDRGP